MPYVAIVLFSVWADGNWPGFRGAGRSGIAPETKVPETWSENSHLVWRLDLPGPGSSSPVHWGGKAFVTCYSGYGVEGTTGNATELKRHLLAVDLKTGKKLWQEDVSTKAEEDPYRGYITEHGYASSTPAVDADRVYAYLGKAGLFAFDHEGKRLWQSDCGVESDPRGWGSAASPLLVGDWVVVNASSESRAILAFEKSTGKQVWKAEGGNLALAFGTPALAKGTDGVENLVVATPGEIWALNPKNGKLVWFAPLRARGNISPSVITGTVAGESIALVTGGFESKGTSALRLGARTEPKGGRVAWEVGASCYVPTPLLHAEKLYWVDEMGAMKVLDATNGKTIHEFKLPLAERGGRSRPVYASLVLVGDKLYCQTRREGVFVLSLGDKPEVLHQNKLANGGDFSATPAPVEGGLLLRSSKSLYRVGMAP